MLIDITGFQGENPKLHPRQLPRQAAQLAANARLDDGVLTPFSGSTFVTDLVTPRKTVYLNGASWLAWDTHVNVLPGPTATDRLYVTGDGAPKMYADDTWYDLALPAPGAAPVTANVTPPAEDAELESVVFAYTFVTSYGEESAPSPLSAALSTAEGIAVRLSSMEAPPAARAITKLRIYRSVTNSYGETDLYFVAEIDPADTFDHDPASYPINEPISTADFSTPPNGLKGIISMPNGMMVGHTKRQIHFCEPYQPHTWPAKYSLTVDYDVVGLSAFGSQLAVMTKGQPYRGQGFHPDSFTLEKIEENLPCTSKRGIVDLGYAAAYPSTDGLVLITANGATLATRALFPRRDWQKLDPSSIVASHLEGRYFFAFSGTLAGAAEKTGIIDLTGETPFFARTDAVMQCAYHDIRTGRLYIQEADNSLYIYDDVDAPDWRPLTWRSKLFDLGFSTSFGCIRVEGTELDAPSAFSCRVYADGALIHTITSLDTAERLPPISGESWEIEVEGAVEITSIAMAHSMSELAGRA